MSDRKLTYFSKQLYPLTALMLSILFMSSCAENNMSDLRKFIADTKLKYPGKVEALPAITPYASYQYESEGRRDPFQPSISLVKTIELKRASNGIKPNSVRNKEDLEQYALESLVMVGIMNNNGQNWAIIKAPDNNIYRVKKGNYMGKNNGKILKISESVIKLKEIVADGLGGWIERPNKLAISE
jgi:type IV pilus assembly protein PilP